MNIELVDIIGLLCNIIAIVFFFIPITNMVLVAKTKDTSKVPWLLFIFTILNCEFWVIYGIKINAWPIYFCNGTGIFTNLLYLSIYFLCQIYKLLWKRIFYISLVLLSFCLSFSVFYTYIKDQNLFGSLACTMNILMFVSPLQNLHLVLKKKDNSFIPINISLCLVVNCMLWTTYGIFKNRDYFMIIPNSIGLLLSILQCVLWLKFRQTSGKMKHQKEQSNFNKENKKDFNKICEEAEEAPGSDEEMKNSQN